MESQEMIKLKEDFKKLTRNEQIALINEKKIELAEIYLDKRLIEIIRKGRSGIGSPSFP